MSGGQRIPVILPDLGVPLARLSVWFAEPGDQVYEGERLVEVAVDGATFDVSAPATGRLAERFALPPDELQPRAVLGEVISD
ncbi:MAG TPA: biotin/lipoyl-containing protein [Gemmataceae bacterium]|jgi:pyruvate/2-oxoglutarate dehydrogenase complex dihydrolipoamide acyltransferase (E2) component|nr:biotin/lipoyl-containing protein [Gemmataceae bacterium]